MPKYSKDYDSRNKSTSYYENWRNREINLGEETYKEFLESDYWQSVKEKARKREQYNRCELCGSTDNIELHHKHYDLIRTKHELSAVIALCRKHHQMVHNIAQKEKCTIRWATQKAKNLYNKEQKKVRAVEIINNATQNISDLPNVETAEDLNLFQAEKIVQHKDRYL